MRLWQLAEDEAMRVFAGNLRDLLLAAPAGARATLGLDPGFRTGVKVAVVDAHRQGRRDDADLSARAAAALGRVARRRSPALRASTRSSSSPSAMARPRARPTSSPASSSSKHPELKLTKIVVSEAGASVYSASAYASQELPDLDVSLRGAVSIARRLQDPLAELVKIDPKSIGVGQYQHDLSEPKLSRSLDAVVEDCVNAVGVDVNTASAPLLARVSGLGETLAPNIVAHRDANGPFRTRAALKEVPRLGAEGLRAVRGLPAHPRRRRSARPLRRASGSLSGGAPHSRGGEDRHHAA